MPTIEELLPEYRAALVSRGHRKQGIVRYMDQITSFARFAGREATVADVTAKLVRRYQVKLSERCGAGTVSNALTVIRSFCRWYLLEDFRDDDPTLKIVWLRLRKPAPRALKRAELRLLNEVIVEPEGLSEDQAFMWRRNRRTVYLMLYAGLRLSETAALRWRDVDMDLAELMVIDGKDGKDRVVPLHSALVEELRKVRNPNPSLAVVGGRDGEPLTHKSLAHIYERWLPGLGIQITAHRLRHSFATEMLRHGADIRAIQELMGHASLETTQRYLALCNEQLRGAVEKLPRSW